MFKRLSVAEAKALIAEKSVHIVDIRDEQSFSAGHMENAQWLNNANVGEFVTTADHATPVIVCCYHGNSSQGAAHMLGEQGFSEAYSLDGGFEAWQASE